MLPDAAAAAQSDVVRDAAFSALLALSEKLLNRHCAFFRLHGIPIIAASTGSSPAPAAAGAVLTAEPWRSALAAGDSVDIYVEKASAWVSGYISTAVLGGQVRRRGGRSSSSIWGRPSGSLPVPLSCRNASGAGRRVVPPQHPVAVGRVASAECVSAAGMQRR